MFLGGSRRRTRLWQFLHSRLVDLGRQHREVVNVEPERSLLLSIFQYREFKIILSRIFGQISQLKRNRAELSVLAVIVVVKHRKTEIVSETSDEQELRLVPGWVEPDVHERTV